VILAAGRLIRSKGYDILIDAVAQLESAGHRDYQVWLIGSGEESERLRAHAVASGLRDRMFFDSWQEPDGLARYMQMADVFVAPARFDPFPTVILQALGYGNPVIASDRVGSAVEFVIDGHNGQLVPAGDASRLFQTLDHLLRARPTIAEMGRAARRTAEEWPVSRGVAILKEALGGC
jgi:glycosyltransferase involved in cell wall biosynthesis